MEFELTVSDVIEIVQPVKVVGNFSGKITQIASLLEAENGALSFLGNKKYISDVAPSRASVLLLPVGFEIEPKEQQCILFCSDPSVALALICQFIEKQHATSNTEIHPTAVIAETATIGENCTIGAHVVIEDGVKIGNDVRIDAGTFIGRNSVIGDFTHLFPNVNVMSFSQIGKHVVIHPGAVIGSDGFGFAYVGQRYEKIPQIGNVVLEDYTDIGANTTIDRARFASTVIGEGTKIDNLVQIGHNVRIGKHCIIVSQVGIAGSTHLGDHITIGGQVGIAGHLRIAEGTQICAQAGITKDTEKDSVMLGSPAYPYKEAVKQFAGIAKLPEILKKIQKYLH